MNQTERRYFELLTKDRAESADTLEKPSMRGVRNSVVEKYSDQAHFIYELLQNADDAKATNARFVLRKNYLLFAHNGKRHFSITDPLREDKATEDGTLGDINAITSIANSNKTEASIGKFGVGFKAVFQYTSTPHIYDETFKFRIDRFIVPVLLNEDHPERRQNETLFVFPFDHAERDAEAAYNDISEKLNSLSFPLLFLSTLQNIEFSFGGTIGLYGKRTDESFKIDDTAVEKITLTHNNGDSFIDDSMWMFTRKDEEHRKYSVAFFLDENEALRPIHEPAFCFFPTKETTGLNFLIHAPFLLTDSREGIRAGIEHNDKMIQKLAELSADSIKYLKFIGQKNNHRIVDDGILDIIPYNPSDFSDPKDKKKISFLPFYERIKEMFNTSEIIPTKEGYTTVKNAYWADVIQLTDLFSNEQLAEITENSEAQWAFVTINRNEAQRSQNTNSKIRALFNYVDSLTRTSLTDDVILNGRTRDFYYDRYSGERKSLENIKGITESFIEKQSVEWLHKFYQWMSETKHRTDIAKEKPIFIDQDYKACSAFDSKKQLIVFLPIKDSSGYRTINKQLLLNENTKSFIQQIGIKEPSLRDQIYNQIIPQYKTDGEIDTDPHFLLFFQYYCECPNDEVDSYIGLIKDCEFLTYYSTAEDLAYRGSASTMYLPTPEIVAYFETKPDARFIALDEYKTLVGAGQ